MYTLDTIIQLGSTKINLPLAATFIDYTGTAVPSQSGVTTGFKEIGLGEYLWHYAAYSDGFRGAVVIHAPSGLHTIPYSSFSINSSEVENSDVKTSSVSAGTTAGLYQITVTTKDQDNNLLPNTTLELYPSGSSSIISKPQTSINSASYVFNLDSGNYQIFSYLPGVASFINPSYITVTSSASIIINGNKFVVTPPSTSGFCRLYAYTSDLGLNTTAGVEMFIRPSGCANISDGLVITKNSVSNISDGIGYVYCDILVGSIPVKIEIPKANFIRYYIPISSDSINVATL